jgi:tetratricopeptide (TPR) repeat protein
VPYLEKALRLDPGELWAHFNLGMICQQQGNLVSAREHFERAAQGGADFNMANYYLAVIENAVGKEARAKEYAGAFLALYATDDRFRREAEAIVRGND